MNINLLMASLIPVLVFTNIIIWDDINWIRFLAVYWQIVSWGLGFTLLKLKFAAGSLDEQ